MSLPFTATNERKAPTNMNEQQTFQSPFRLFLLRCHAAWTKFEDVVLYVPRQISNAVSATPAWQAAERAHLRIVK